MANIELPKDAEGREIPLDVDALYSKDGIRTLVFAWKYFQPRKRKWTVQFLFDDSDCIYFPEDYYLTPPDTWEKLEEDLDRGIQADSLCMYHSTKRVCKECPINSEGICHNAAITLKDIKRRIRRLRGEN